MGASLRSLRREVQANAHGGSDERALAPVVDVLEFVDWSLDQVRNLDREMQSMIRDGEQNRRLLSKTVDDILDDVKRATMLPFATLFDVLPRMVRDLARTTRC